MQNEEKREKEKDEGREIVCKFKSANNKIGNREYKVKWFTLATLSITMITITNRQVMASSVRSGYEHNDD